jgi:hypothetical protein
MIKQLFSAMTSSSRNLFRNWRALMILVLLYVAMIGAAYLFFATREATLGQLVLTLLVALLAPALFFLIQMTALRLKSPKQRLLSLVGGALRDFWKLFAISLPVILLAVLAVYVLGLIEVKDIEQAGRLAPVPVRSTSGKPPAPLQWQAVLLTALKYLLLALVAPLAAIHLWIAAARDGLKAAIKGAVAGLACAFAPGSVITYALGFAVFAVAPYFLISTKTTGGSTSTDVGLFVLRIGLAIVVSLVGWVITLGALDELTTRDNKTASEVKESAIDLSEGLVNVPTES